MSRGSSSPGRLLAACAVAIAALIGSTRPTAQAPDPAVGRPLAPWQPGLLDIHHISTGRGNSTLIVFPDATTLLVDAGAAGDGIPQTEPHPDGSRTPGDWIARYIRRHLPSANPALDYALVTHFHADHVGQVVAASPLDRTGTYRLTGLTEVAESVPIGTVIDRGYPDYAYPAPLTDPTMTSYRAFVEARRREGRPVERFQPGSHEQIRLRHDPARYPDVEIRNIIGNGTMWTGTGSMTRDLFPPITTLSPDDRPNENLCSLAIRVQAGRFRYFTGGDLAGTPDPGVPDWQAVEAAIAPVIGPVDVHAVNQHGSMGEESEPFLRTLASRVLVIPSWAPSHPAPDVLKRIMNSRFAPRDRLVFAIDLRDAARIVIGQRATQLAGPPGHVVVRIGAGGDYRVFVLTNRDESDTVLAVRGPFAAGGGSAP